MYRDYQNTIKIPVRVKNGVIQNYYGGPLPEIYDKVFGELIFPEYAIKDKDFIKMCNYKKIMKY